MKDKTKAAVGVGAVLGIAVGAAILRQKSNKPPKKQAYGVPPYSKPVQKTIPRGEKENQKNTVLKKSMHYQTYSAQERNCPGSPDHIYGARRKTGWSGFSS